VTFYVSSTLNWKDRGLALTQTTDLPLTNKVTFTITAAPTDAVNVQFRKPDWASTCQVAVAVNGQAVTPVESNGFLGVSRVWQANDTVQLAFPLFVQTSRLQDNQNAVAFTYGPLVLSAGLGTASMTTTGHAMTIAATSPGGLQDTIKINTGTINDWLSGIQTNLVQTAGKLEFNLKGTDSDGKLVFIPHYSRYKDRYGIYWKLSGTAGGTATTAVTCPTVSTGGSGGTGGASGSGGIDGSAGRSGGSDAGPGSGGAGASSAGGAGGAQSAGGQPGAGSGGSSTSSAGGAQSSGGRTSTGSGGSNGSGGAAAGGAQASGGTSASGGAGGSTHASGGTSGAAGSGGASASSGCSCNVGSTDSRAHGMVGLLLGLGMIAWRRRRRR
jgi:MYXO-CTERM domain-containing protein